jgi:hypothetical protein
MTLAANPRIKGMSEKLIVSHYENNYGGAVKRLNSSNLRASVSVWRPAISSMTSSASSSPPAIR